MQVNKLLGQMTPSNVRVDVQTSSFSNIPDSPVQQEPWFGMPYISRRIPEEILTQWESASVTPELQLPPHNSFIPTDFSLRSDDTATASTSSGTAADTQSPAPPEVRQPRQLKSYQQAPKHVWVRSIPSMAVLSATATRQILSLATVSQQLRRS